MFFMNFHLHAPLLKKTIAICNKVAKSSKKFYADKRFSEYLAYK